MLKSIVLAGLFWAIANLMPLPAIGTPTVAAGTVVNAVVRAPVLLASAPRPARQPELRVAWEVPTPVQMAPVQAAPVSPGVLSNEEQEFVARVNAERTERGLNTLSVDPLMVRAARAHSREMCGLSYFDHHSPTPSLNTPMDRYLQGLRDQGSATPESLLVGENIYYCSVFNDIYNVEYSHRAFMNSPGHRANILEKRFTKVGLGVYRNARGEFWVTEMFSRDTE